MLRKIILKLIILTVISPNVQLHWEFVSEWNISSRLIQNKTSWHFIGSRLIENNEIFLIHLLNLIKGIIVGNFEMIRYEIIENY